MSRTRTILLAAATAVLLGAGLPPAGAGPGQQGLSARPLDWIRFPDPVVLRPSNVVRDSACSPTGPSCFAVGYGFDDRRSQTPSIQRWDGTAWHLETLAARDSEGLRVIDCGTESDCVALEAPLFDGGHERRLAVRSVEGWRWVPYEVEDDLVEYTSVSCSAPSHCVLSGGGRAAALYDGVGVRPLPPAPDTLYSLSCPTTAYCVGATATAFAEWDGARWSTTAATESDVLGELDCWAAESCLALTDDGPAASYERLPASGWRRAAPPPGREVFDELGIGDAPNLDCVAGGVCHLVRAFGPSEQPQLRLVTWRQGVWDSATVPQPDGVVPSFACRPDECVFFVVHLASKARLTTASAVHGYGTEWVERSVPSSVGVLPETTPHELTCPARDWCLALGAMTDVSDENFLVRWDGTRWIEVPTTIGEQRDLDCWLPDHCVVVGAEAGHPRAAVLRAGSWRSLPALSPRWLSRGRFTAVSCDSARCLYAGTYRASDGAGTGIFVARRAKGHWRAERIGPLVSGDRAFTGRPSLDCPSRRRCVGVVSARLPGERSITSFELLLDDRDWRLTSLGKGFSLYEIDCADVEHCVAGGDEKRPALAMARSADGTWRRIATRTRNAAFYSISCPTTQDCYLAAYGTRVHHVTRVGNGWRARPVGPRQTTDISCAGPRWCLTFNFNTTWLGH